MLPRAGGLRSITTPVYLFQGRVDFVFDLTQASSAFATLGGPKKLYVGNFGHPPSTFPGVDIAHVTAESRAWFDRFLKGTRNGVDTGGSVVIAKQGSATARKALPGLPATRTQTLVVAGTSTVRGNAVVSRRTAPLAARSRPGAAAPPGSPSRSWRATRASSSPCWPGTGSSRTAACSRGPASTSSSSRTTASSSRAGRACASSSDRLARRTARLPRLRRLGLRHDRTGHAHAQGPEDARLRLKRLALLLALVLASTAGAASTADRA